MSKAEYTYTEARRKLAALWDQVVNERSAIIIHRRGKEDVAVLPAIELEALLEAAHLLRSPKNARRLFAAMERAVAREGQAQSIDQLKVEFGLDRVV